MCGPARSKWRGELCEPFTLCIAELCSPLPLRRTEDVPEGDCHPRLAGVSELAAARDDGKTSPQTFCRGSRVGCNDLDFAGGTPAATVTFEGAIISPECFLVYLPTR
jgi:hypothetical protein